MKSYDLSKISYIEKKKFLNEDEAKKILIDILKGLEVLSFKGIIHRDLKPANILIKDNVFVKWIRHIK